MKRDRTAAVLLAVGTVVLSMEMGAALYQIVVDVPNWFADVPQSLGAVRALWTRTNPGNYFRIIDPLAIVALLAALLTGWNRPRERNVWVVAAVCAAVLVEVGTFLYFFPRNELLFFGPLEAVPAESLVNAAQEWTTANYARVVVLVAGAAAAVRALTVPG